MYQQKMNTKIAGVKVENAEETRKRLEILFGRSFAPEVLNEVALDKRETARFIADKARILRLAANAGGFQALTWMIENIFYEAYGHAQSRKSESIEFVKQENLQ